MAETGADCPLLGAQRGSSWRISTPSPEAVTRQRRQLGHSVPEWAGQRWSTCAPKGAPRGRRRFGGVNGMQDRAKGMQMPLFQLAWGVLRHPRDYSGLLQITPNTSIGSNLE